MTCKFKAVLLLTLTVLFVNNVECYPHKRATGGLPQILHGLLTDNTTMQSLTGTPSIMSLLETQNQLLGKIVVSMNTLTKGMILTAGDCSDVATQGPYASGIYLITPWDDLGHQVSFRVQCDMETAGGGWTVFQRRFDGSVDFYRGWEDYKNGFGDLAGEFWMGLANLNRLTRTGLKWELRIELEDFENNTAYAHYDNFRIGDETKGFQLTIGAYSGTAGDSLTPRHANMAFTTKDRDNDLYGGNCAGSYKGGWWYGGCHHANLNGLYLGSPQVTPTGMSWWHLSRSYKTLKRSEMKIRPTY